MIRLQIRTHSVRVITATHYVPPPELVLPLLSANMAKACPRLGSRSMTRLALNRRAFARRRASSTVIPLGTSKNSQALAASWENELDYLPLGIDVSRYS